MDYAEKLKLAHDSYDAFNRRDLETLLQLYDPECEWHMSHYPAWPEIDLVEDCVECAVPPSARPTDRIMETA